MSWMQEERTCPRCGEKFFPNAPNQKYHDEACKQAAENERWYAAHKAERIAQVAARRKVKREEQRKALETKMALAGMQYMNTQLALGNPQIDLTNTWREYLPEGTPRTDYQLAMRAFRQGVDQAIRMREAAGMRYDDEQRDDEA